MDREITYKKLLEQFYEEDNEDNLKKIKSKIYQKYGTNRRCFRCGTQLLISDLKEYSYLCLECNENFYEFEVEGR